jgi:hypothetical protein
MFWDKLLCLLNNTFIGTTFAGLFVAGLTLYFLYIKQKNIDFSFSKKEEVINLLEKLLQDLNFISYLFNRNINSYNYADHNFSEDKKIEIFESVKKDNTKIASLLTNDLDTTILQLELKSEIFNLKKDEILEVIKKIKKWRADLFILLEMKSGPVYPNKEILEKLRNRDTLDQIKKIIKEIYE